jgi:type I restriction enzyme S subunit
MSKQWPKVKLGEVLRRVERFEPRDELTEYPFAGTYSFARGIFVGERKLGSTFALPKIQRIRAGDFIYCKIMAWEGAFGIAPKGADNCVMSGAFVVYELNRGQIDEKFLDYFFKVPDHWQSIGSQSSGTNVRRQSLHPSQFEKAEIPLPPLAEQRRVVARIEELAAQINEASTLRNQAAEETEKLMAGEERRIWPDGALVGAPTLAGVCTFLARGKQSEQGESDHFLIKTQHVQQDQYLPTLMRLAPHTAAKVKAEAIVQHGDTLIACSAAGCLGRVARFRDEGKTASTDTHVAVARANTDVVHSDYLYAYLRGAQGQHQLRSRERGDWQREKISFRLTELNLNDLRKVPIPVPPLPEQRRIVAELDTLQAEVDALKRLQAETAAELDALLPSILDRAFNGGL